MNDTIWAALIGVASGLLVVAVSSLLTADDDYKKFLRQEKMAAYSAFIGAYVRAAELLVRVHRKQITRQELEKLTEINQMFEEYARVVLVGSTDVREKASILTDKYGEEEAEGNSRLQDTIDAMRADLSIPTKVRPFHKQAT